MIHKIKTMQAIRYTEQLYPFRRFAVQEKFDGIRAVYNDGALYTRNCNVIASCEHITAALNDCNMILDGEIYMPGSTLGQIAGAARAKAQKQDLCFYAFDVINERPQHERFNQLASVEQSASVKTILPIETNHTESVYNAIIASGGEGIIVRDMEAFYSPGYSTSVLKIKPNYITEDDFPEFDF